MDKPETQELLTDLTEEPNQTVENTENTLDYGLIFAYAKDEEWLYQLKCIGLVILTWVFPGLAYIFIHQYKKAALVFVYNSIVRFILFVIGTLR
jgi:hypothetical protein